MTKYKVSEKLQLDVLRIVRCLGVLNVTFDCHTGAGVAYNILKKLGYNVEERKGAYSSPHLNNGKKTQHSWVELILDPYGLSILIELVPSQMFPELSPEEQSKNFILPPDDEKRKRYERMPESFMKEVFEKARVKIDKEYIERLCQCVELCISMTLEREEELRKRKAPHSYRV